ncbi:hypothetical protein Bca52824_010923 [Brassica carinata]|uniref:F-box domain-containing protein n=1 Tax=Brassica carinata TaxID=52824 RepID=A0A8X8BAM1_BRACI|nr:hypothetical protein Bca52824_010923 [Brassica carinata]
MESRQQKVHQSILTRSSNLTNTEEYSEPIPVDLIIEIVSRLPEKSVARCRCVSKFWASILSRQEFTETFLARSLARPQLFSSFPHLSQNTDENSYVTANYHMNLPCERIYTVRHISGLVYIREHRILNGSKHVLVWKICNPITGQCFTLPEVKPHKGYSWILTFFGYDPIEKQVKVLTITWEHEGDNVISNEHHVLTLETDKVSWRRIECGAPHSPSHDGVCISGVLYYKASEKAFSNASMIVCFDVRSEKYNFIRVRESSSGAVHPTTTLINYNSKLASLTTPTMSYFDEDGISFDMWVLQDPRKEEWSKHSYKLTVCRSYSFGVTGTNEIVFFRDSLSAPFCVFYYNLERKTIRRVQIRGMRKFEGKKIFKLF